VIGDMAWGEHERDQRGFPVLAVPTLIIHGDADASSPLPLTRTPTAALVPDVRLVVYENAPHRLYLTHAERLNRDLLAFIEGEQHLAAPLGRAGVL
jgi:pimeloyl-ACP methyl ester carboxylesterase